MKELSIEEKAKAYDEAIKRLEDIKTGKCQKTFMFTEVIFDYIFPELKEESEDERIRKYLISFVELNSGVNLPPEDAEQILAWLEKQGEQKPTLPKWKYKKDNTPLSRDSLILNKYGCVAKSPSGALVSDVWVIDYDELAKLPKEEYEKQGEQKPVFEMKTPEESLGIESDTYSKIVDECIYGEQKPAWSEEDEMHIRELESLVKQVWATAEHENDKDTIHKMSDLSFFLKTLKPQPKQEWSEEDEQAIEDAETWLDSLCDYLKDSSSECISTVKEVISKLKSIRPQNTWKPSDEQLKAIKWIMDGDSPENWIVTLANLYNDLKKLKG